MDGLIRGLAALVIAIFNFRVRDIDEVLHVECFSNIDVVGLLDAHQNFSFVDISVLHECSGLGYCVMSVLL